MLDNQCILYYLNKPNSRYDKDVYLANLRQIQSFRHDISLTLSPLGCGITPQVIVILRNFYLYTNRLCETRGTSNLQIFKCGRSAGAEFLKRLKLADFINDHLGTLTFWRFLTSRGERKTNNNSGV